MSAVHFPAADTRRLIVAAIPEWLNAQDDLASRKMVPFLPASHARALHFRVPLVVGIRGSGKSLWCSILGNIEQRNKLLRQINDFSIDPSVQVYTGFAEQGNPGDFPGRGVLADLMAKFPLPDIWRAIMAHHVLETEQKPPFYGWEQRVRWVREHRESIDNAFYQTDEQLRDKKQHRLVLFDALDRTADDWGTMQRMLKELLMLLLEFRSFQAIHPKAFVRPDLLSDPAVTAFPDSSKLIANKESLLWPPRDLYNLFWHLLANQAEGGDRFRAVCEREFGLPWHQEEGLWLIPDALRIEEPRQRQVLHAITGPFMGRDPKRGIPYTWLVNHLADSLQQISPRSFLAAMRKAAQGDLSEPRVYPLQGDDIRLGVQEASRIRVAEVEEDVPWVAQLMKPLAGLIIPASFNEIAKRWQDDDSLERIRKGSAQGNRRLYPRRMDLEGEAGVGRDLEELGIFQRLKNDRINLPDVYRIGFNLRRKGGIPALAAERPIKADAAAVPEPAIIHPWSGLSILHLSDLHFGEHCRFAEMDPAELGERTAKSVQEVLPKNQRLDLVIVTGDLTEQAKPNQFRQVHAFLDALAGAAGINRDRFVLLPGNHDVSRAVCLRVMSELEEQDIFTDEAFFQRVETEKFKNFEDFLSGFLASRDHIQSLERGGRIWNFPRLRLSVAALNSCERITHRPDETRGQLSAEQVESFLASWGKGSDRLKILALHHNPSGVPQQSIEGWNTYIDQEKRLSKEQIECILDDAGGFQDKGRVQQLVRQCHPQLLLYGHQHASMENDLWRWDTDGYTSLLGAGSLGIVEEKLPKDFPNACQLIEITVDGKMKIVPLEYDPRAGVSGKADPGRFISRETAKPLTLCLPEGLFAEEQPIPERTSPRRTSFLAAYRQRFTNARPRWDLSHTGVALAMGFKPEQAALNDMYLPLRLGEKDDPDALDLGAVLSPGEVVNLSQPMIIRGQAGAGKTTWIRWTFHQLLQLNHTFPIRIELRSLARYWERVPRDQSSVEGYLEDWMKNEHRMGGWYDELMAFLEQPGSVRPVLLIDGWDELGDLGHDFRDKLRKFLNTHPSVRCVVTSRPYGAGRPTGGDGFAERVIQPLNKGEIQELVAKFFRHAVDSPDTAHKINEFIAALERSEKAGEMARTALLLTLMLLISRTAPLPEKRVDLFEQCVKTMIGTIPEKRKEQGARKRAEAWAPEDPHERIRVTAELAHAIQSDDIEGEKQSFRTAKLLAREKIVQLKWGAGWTVDDRIKFINWLLDSAGIFMERSDNQLQFIHLSFQEYLTAAYLKANTTDTDRPERFVQLADNPSWWETLRLWAALIANENPDNLELVLKRLLDCASKNGLFLAGTILADGVGQDFTFSRWLDEFVKKLHEFWSDNTDTVLQFWARSRKEERRQLMEAKLHQAGKKAQTWMEWIRVDFSATEVKLSSPPPPESSPELTHWVVQSFFGFSLEVKALAAHRIPAAVFPLWSGSIAPWIVLLRLLPGRRSRLGQHLQVFVSSERKEGNLIYFGLQIDHLIGSPLNQEEVDYVRDLASDFASDFASDLASDFARDYARDLARAFARSFARAFARDYARDLASDYSSTFASDYASDFARDYERNYAFVLMFRRMRALMGLSKMNLGINEDNIDHVTTVFSELFLPARISPRAFLAHETKQLLPLTPPEWQPEMRLFEVACRRSFDPKGDPEPFRDALRQYEQERQNDHPIWPLLAKLIARHIKKGDQEFKELEQIIRNPEQSGLPAPYADAVRYWWRGDLLLLDGSEITLDHLLGIDLPYLEEMPDELDWGG